MKKCSFQLLPAIAVALLLTACHPARLVIDPALTDTAVVLPVKGRNGFQIGQKLSFGDYATGKVRRGWTKGYDIPFRVRFQGAKEKLSYDLNSPDGLAADVSCISKFQSIELPLIRDYFAIPLKVENFFAGNILLDDGRTNWDFIVYNPEGGFLTGGETVGYAQNGRRRIEVVPIRQLEGQPKWLDPLSVYGFEFKWGGKSIGAVSLIDKGEVRLQEGLEPELRMVTAALATGLLLRHSPAETMG